jgi:AraC family transcriptional regulator
MRMSQVFSFQDWYRNGPFAARPQAHRSVVPEAHQTIRAGAVYMINMSPPAGQVIDPPVPEYVLHLVLSTPPLLRVGFNRPPRWLVMSPGVLLAVPPDTAGEFIDDSSSHVLTIGIPKARVADFTEDSGTRVEIRREETFRDPRLMRELIQLWHALANDAPASRLFADQVTSAVLQSLALRTNVRLRPPRRGSERLTHRTVRLLRDYVEDNLAHDLDVAMLADLAALSPAHFARAFAATVGITPFHYVITRRLARARELLIGTRRSALDIALEVGFKTPSHFAARFRREFDMTPRELRSDARDLETGLHLDGTDSFKYSQS